MIYNTILEIPYVEEMAIVINVNTTYLSTLAVLSLLRNTELPVLIIDCPFNDNNESYDYFKILMKEYDFNLIQLPLNTHGTTLDYIFKNVKSDRLLLLDSDAEVISKEIIPLLLTQSKKETFFGAGFNNEFRKDGHPNFNNNIADG